MFHYMGCCCLARSLPRKISIPSRRGWPLPGLFRRRRDCPTAFRRRQVGLLRVVAHHARGREPRSNGGNRSLHHLDPLNRQVIGIALIVERDNLFFEDIVERLTILVILCVGVGVFLRFADGPTRVGVLYFTPPTVRDGKIDAAIRSEERSVGT